MEENADRRHACGYDELHAYGPEPLGLEEVDKGTPERLYHPGKI